VDTERAAMKPTVAKVLRAEVIIFVSPVETPKTNPDSGAAM
jgi:hypothetical protein